MMTVEEALNKIVEILTRQDTTSWRPIDNGRQQSSYQEYTITIAPHGNYTLNSPFNYFRCLSSNQPGFKVAWSTNNGQTDFEAGLGVKFDQLIPYAQIFNTSDSTLILSVGVGLGYIDDSRLSVTGGVIKTEPAQYSNFSVNTMTFGETGALEIPPAQKIIIQNTGSSVVYIGGTGTDGLQLQPQGSFECSFAGNVTVRGTNGQTISVGSFN